MPRSHARSYLVLLLALAACSEGPSATDVEAPTAVLRVLDTQGVVIPNARVAAGAEFTLDGSQSSDAEGTIATYRWTRLATSTAVETTTPTLNPVTAFFAGNTPGLGNHDFQLVVVDGSGNQSVPAQLRVTVVDEQAPTAVLRVLNAQGAVVANARIAFGAAFTLDGSQSMDVGGTVVAYRWTRIATSTTVETTTPTMNPITAFFGGSNPVTGNHDFQLVVVDNSGNESTPVQLRVTVVDDQAPTAVMRVLDAQGVTVPNAQIAFGAAFTLDGSQSLDTGGGSIVTYRWTRMSTNTTVETTTATLNPISAFFGGSSPAAGNHDFRLVVVDNSGNESSPVQLRVVVLDNQMPTAILRVLNAQGTIVANARITFGSAFTLDGSASFDTGGGSIVSYRWTRVATNTTVQTTTATLNPITTFFGGVNPGVGNHDFMLVVVDNSGNESFPVQLRVAVIQ